MLTAGELPTGWMRARAGGRPLAEEIDPSLLSDLEALVEPDTRGDPMSALRWTRKSTRELAGVLGEMGHQVSHSLVGTLLHELCLPRLESWASRAAPHFGERGVR